MQEFLDWRLRIFLAIVVATLLLAVPVGATADDYFCGTSATPDTTGGGQQPPADYSDLGLVFHRYHPSDEPGKTDIEFTYSESIREGFPGSNEEQRTAAIEAALDALAIRITDDIHNTIGSSWTDIEFLHNWGSPAEFVGR